MFVPCILCLVYSGAWYENDTTSIRVPKVLKQTQDGLNLTQQDKCFMYLSCTWHKTGQKQTRKSMKKTRNSKDNKSNIHSRLLFCLQNRWFIEFTYKIIYNTKYAIFIWNIYICRVVYPRGKPKHNTILGLLTFVFVYFRVVHSNANPNI